jgi:hypothetical protein
MTLRSTYRYGRLVVKHGPLYPARRSLLPRRILSARPIYTEKSGDLKVCVLTSRADWLLCLWTLVGFYEFSRRRDPLLIYSDGTLTPDHCAGILKVFPNAQIVDRHHTDAIMTAALAEYPNCRRYRRSQPCALRIVDLPVVCDSRFILMVDSDILFFQEPAELNRRLDARQPGGFVFQRDIQDAYFASRDRIRADFGIDLPPAANCGIMLADVSGFHHDWLERWLCRPEIFTHGWSEQTLWAMYGAMHRADHLGEEYDLRMTRGLSPRAVMKHYVKPIRDLMYMEGIPHLAGLLAARGVFGSGGERA